jgi:hypothetical protein
MRDNDTQTPKPGMAVHKYIRQPRHEPETEEADESFKEGRAKSREALMLDVVFTDGHIESFDYSMPKRVTYKPDGTLILRFGQARITVEGHNLERLRVSVTECRARTIKQGTEARQDIGREDAMHIDRITITEGDEES